MNKTVLIIVGVLVLAIGGYFVGNALRDSKISGTEKSPTKSPTSVQPQRKAEIYGKIKSVIGNELTITKTDPSADPTINMASGEKRAYMQSLDEAERIKLKEDILNASLGGIKVLVNVGIPITKKAEQGPDAQVINGSLADLKIGGVVSVWLDNSQADRNIAEFIKITFTR